MQIQIQPVRLRGRLEMLRRLACVFQTTPSVRRIVRPVPSRAEDADGSIRCTAPSGLACLNDQANLSAGFKPAGSACSFSYFGDDAAGVCFAPEPVLVDGNPILGADGNVMVSTACVDTCDPVLQTGCANPNSMCQATGIRGCINH